MARTCNLVLGRDTEVARWTASRLGTESFGDCSAIGIEKDGELIAGLVYFCYRHPNIEMAIASTSPYWANRFTLYHIFYYPLVFLNCQRVTVMVDSTNQKSISLVERLGFVREGLLRQARPDCDVLVYGMLKTECRWLSYGKEKRAKRS